MTVGDDAPRSQLGHVRRGAGRGPGLGAVELGGHAQVVQPDGVFAQRVALSRERPARAARHNASAASSVFEGGLGPSSAQGGGTRGGEALEPDGVDVVGFDVEAVAGPGDCAIAEVVPNARRSRDTRVCSARNRSPAISTGRSSSARALERTEVAMRTRSLSPHVADDRTGRSRDAAAPRAG